MSLYCKALPFSVCSVHLAVLGAVGGGLASSAHEWLLQHLGAVIAQRGIAALPPPSFSSFAEKSQHTRRSLMGTRAYRTARQVCSTLAHRGGGGAKDGDFSRA